MTPISADQWRGLEERPASFGELRAVPLDSGTSAFLAVDHDGARHLLLGIRSEEQGLSDSRSRGVRVDTRRLVVEGAPEAWFIDVKATDSTALDMFNKIGDEVVTALEGGQEPAEAVELVLGRWRRFWAGVPDVGLTAEALRGLFGELWFLAEWLVPVDNRHVLAWTGPSGGRHDFQWPAVACECKATVSSRGHIHWINGLDQMDPPEGGTLYVFSIRIREEPSAGNSLPVLIELIYEELRGKPDLLDYFDQQLAASGYSPAHADRYQAIRWRIVDQRVFTVADGFPRLSNSMIEGGLPIGVERVDYLVDLNTCWDLAKDELPRLPAL